MCPEYLAPLTNHRGIGLITAVFAIVILALFGLLIARFTVTTQTSSTEDYLWAQALYSAESVMRLNILGNDGGGGITAPVNPTVGGIPALPPTTDGTTLFAFTATDTPTTIQVQAKHDGTKVSRTVEAKYLLPAPPP
ncbi:MAG: hypothetical protein WCT30_05080 [Desulfurivibrionaceae bacterium]